MFAPGAVAIQKWNFPLSLVTNVTLEWAISEWQNAYKKFTYTISNLYEIRAGSKISKKRGPSPVSQRHWLVEAKLIVIVRVTHALLQ